MEMLNELIEHIVENLQLDLSAEDKLKYNEVLSKIFISGMKPQEVLGISDEMIEHMYSYGYRLYNLGKYEQASHVFLGITIFTPADPRFHLALAASYQRLKKYGQAVESYYRYSLLDTHNPLPFYYMYDCYYQVGQISDAEICLLEAIQRCGNQKMYAKIKERTKLLLENLQKEKQQLKKEGAVV